MRIKTLWGAEIDAAVSKSSVPAAFLAALVAGESGGDPKARRYEPRVAHHLADKHPDWDGDKVYANASSWGLTQILGENYPDDPAELANPQTNLSFAVIMLAEFAHRFQLDLATEFDPLFRCWNTGEPGDNPATPKIEGKTFDPEYVPRGLARIEIYKKLVGL